MSAAPITTDRAGAAVEQPSRSLRETWPIHRHQAVVLTVGGVILTLLYIGVGKLITGPWDDSALVHRDERVANWMVDRRTPSWNDLTMWGSFLAETVTKVAVTAILALVLLKLFRRWFEPMVLVVPLVLEAAVFIISTNVVNRHRPDVPHLDGSPVGSSFPSGHAAAAAVYVAIAVVVFWHTRSRWARGAVVLVTAVIPVIVSLSRMYRGMHFLSDTVAGVFLGLVVVLFTTLVLARSPEGERALAERSGDAPVEGGPCPS